MIFYCNDGIKPFPLESAFEPEADLERRGHWWCRLLCKARRQPGDDVECDDDGDDLGLELTV